MSHAAGGTSAVLLRRNRVPGRLRALADDPKTLLDGVVDTGRRGSDTAFG